MVHCGIWDRFVVGLVYPNDSLGPVGELFTKHQGHPKYYSNLTWETRVWSSDSHPIMRNDNQPHCLICLHQIYIRHPGLYIWEGMNRFATQKQIYYLYSTPFVIEITLTNVLSNFKFHYSDVIMGAMASQITSLASVYSIVDSCAYQRKHQSSASLAFVWGIHRWPANSPHKWSVTRKMFPFDDVIMFCLTLGMHGRSVVCERAFTDSVCRSRFPETHGFES